MKKIKIIVLTVVATALFACNSNEKNTSSTDILKSAKNIEAEATLAPPLIFDHYEIVRLLKQPKSMDCWATALTILYSWKNNDQAIKIEEVVKKYGDLYSILFQTNAGITATDEQALYRAAHLTVISGANPTIEAWFNLLKSHGPLSITVALKSIDNPPKRYIHALVVNGIKGDGTADNTFIDYVDPADGKQHNISFKKFLGLYEAGAPWPLQIIYW